MLTEQLMYLGAAVLFVAGLGAVVSTLRGQMRPNRVSWAVWSVTSWLAFGGQLDESVGTAALLTLAAAATPTLILLASFVGGSSGKLRRLDIVCGALSVVTLVAWQMTASGLVAIVLSIAVDAIAGVPTVVKAWRKPESESHWPYTAGVFSALCTLLAVEEFTLANSAFAVYFLLLCSTLSTELLVVPRLRRATSGPVSAPAPSSPAPSAAPAEPPPSTPSPLSPPRRRS